MEFRCQVLYEKTKTDGGSEWLVSSIIKFLQIQKNKFERKEITAGTIKNYYQAVKSFCEMNGIVIPIPWKKLQKGLPLSRKFGDDRAPTLEEIRKIIEYPDRRIKAIVCMMVSSGIRVGAWDYLKFKHIIPLKREGHIVAAKLIVYAGEDDQYFTFMSREAYLEVEKMEGISITIRRTSERGIMGNEKYMGYEEGIY
jgi:hypothetical protein